ncbi:ComEC/Rec2 family competence protein [Pseudalkalibacillus sp. A8]|uniref:ComEC/Rec2 family competence protein n=1 Tax=Pseudalkalibacillus sp. A8 TaxID=3382641 RepID=UPI0038B4971C
MENLQLGVVTLGRLNVIMMFGMSLSFYLLVIAWEKGAKRVILPCLCILLVIGVQLYYPKMNAKAYVTFLDVGQGDSIVIELPYRRAVYVIDTGGIITFKQEEWMERRRKFDTGEDIVAEFLKGRGLRKVNALILSHGDLDHIGGVDGLLEKVRVERIVYGKLEHLEASEVEFLKGINAPTVFLEENISWKVGSSFFQTLNPDQAKESRNNRSLVLFVRIHGQSFLFTGDIDQGVEARLLGHYPELKVDYLKVAHHGSETSTSPIKSRGCFHFFRRK